MFIASMQTRRRFLASIATASLKVLLGAAPGRVYGVNLASVRGLMRRDPDQVLRNIASIGYKEIEGYGRTETMALLPRLKQYGLVARACQCETPLVTADWENYPDFKRIPLPEAIDSLKNAGIEYFVSGDISAGARGDGDDFYRRTADRMNDVGLACRKAGLKFVWQIQSFELEGRMGLRPLDIFRDRLDPKLAPMELDAFRVSLAGHDPAAMLKEWRGRIATLRLLDKTKGTRPMYEDNVPQGAFADLGDGVLDVPAVVKAAQSAGIKTFYVGQAPPDDGAADPLAGLRKNFDYLNKL
jgi:sugar phosphate isomerase/epimerase